MAKRKAAKPKPRKGFPVRKAVALVVLIILAAAGWFAYADIQTRYAAKDLQVVRKSANLVSEGGKDMFVIGLSLSNSGTTKAVLDVTDFTVYYNGLKFGSGSSPQTEIPAGGSVDIVLSFPPEPGITAADVISLIRGGGEGSVEGVAHARIIGIPMDTPFSFPFA